MARIETLKDGLIENPPAGILIGRELATVALGKVKDADKVGRMRIIYLLDKKSNTIYKISYDEPIEVDGVVRSDMREGLFVYGFRTGKGVPFDEREFWFMLPRDPEIIDSQLADKITLNSTVESIRDISKSISKANTLSRPSYKDAYEKHRRNLASEASLYWGIGSKDTESQQSGTIEI